MKKFALAMLTVLAGLMAGCQNNTPTFGPPPPEPAFVIDASDPNNLIFTVTSNAGGFMTSWDFGNGYLSQKLMDTVYFPFEGAYTVTLSVFGQGGMTFLKQDVNIAVTDPKICADIYYKLLSGGCEVEQKIWMVRDADSTFGNGGPSSKDEDGNGTSSYSDKIGSKYYWYASTKAGDNLPSAASLDDEYIFGLKGFTYKNDCKGEFRFNWKWLNHFFNAERATYADTTWAYTPNDPATWELERVDATADTLGGKQGYFLDGTTNKRFNLVLKLSDDNYIGYCSGTSVYQILEITEDYMFLRHELAEPTDPSATGSNRIEWRYLRLVAKK